MAKEGTQDRQKVLERIEKLANLACDESSDVKGEPGNEQRTAAITALREARRLGLILVDGEQAAKLAEAEKRLDKAREIVMQLRSQIRQMRTEGIVLGYLGAKVLGL